MKTQHILIALASLLMTGTVCAQFNQYGRIAQRGERGYIPPPKQIPVKEIERPEINAYSEERAVYFSEQLGFDAFQKEVLKTYLKNYYTAKHDVEFNPDLKYNEKLPLISKHQESFRQELITFLKPEQVTFIMKEEHSGSKEIKSKREGKWKKRKRKNKGY